MQQSWYLNFHINDVHTLFNNQILPYEVDCYICSCGNKKTIIKNAQSSKINYICEECGNEEYLEANRYINNYIWYDKVQDILPSDIIESLKTKVYLDENKKLLTCSLYLDIPKTFDIVSDKLIYSRKNLFEIKIDDLENLEYNLYANFDLDSLISDEERYFDKVSTKTLINRDEYLSQIKKEFLFKLKNLTTTSQLTLSDSIEEFSFFLINTHLKDKDFYSWGNIELLPTDKPLTIIDALMFVSNNRKEKSLKRFILNDYSKQLKKNSSYDFIYIYTLCKFIKDINILIRFLNIDLTHDLNALEDKYSFYEFIEFLVSKFSIKQIENSLKECHKDKNYFLVDTIELFSFLKDDLDEIDFKSCNMITLHNSFSKYHRELSERKIFDIKFDYDERYLNACKDINDYQIRLPKDGKELYEWSNSLKNCLSGYVYKIKNKSTVIYGFFNNDELRFAVEVKNNNIIESKRKYNEELLEKENSFVIGWFKANLEI